MDIPNYYRHFAPLPNGATQVPLIVKPIKLPRHTYTQVSLVLHVNRETNLVHCIGVSKGRLHILKRNFDISL